MVYQGLGAPASDGLATYDLTGGNDATRFTGRDGLVRYEPGDRLVASNPDYVVFDPVEGWVTPYQNRYRGRDITDVVLPVLAVVVGAGLGGGLGGMSGSLFGRAAAAGLGAMVGSAGVTAVSGGSFSWSDMLRAGFRGAVVAGVMHWIDGIEIDTAGGGKTTIGQLGAATVVDPATGAVTTVVNVGERLVSYLLTVASSGFLEEVFGGSFRDGFVASTANRLASDLGASMRNELAGMTDLSPADRAMALRAISTIEVMVRIALTEGDPAQAVAMAWLNREIGSWVESQQGEAGPPPFDDEGNLMPGVVDPALPEAEQREVIRIVLIRNGVPLLEALRLSMSVDLQSGQVAGLQPSTPPADAPTEGGEAAPPARPADDEDATQPVDGDVPYVPAEVLRRRDAILEREPELDPGTALELAQMQIDIEADGGVAGVTRDTDFPSFADDLSELIWSEREAIVNASGRSRTALEDAALDSTLANLCADTQTAEDCEKARGYYGEIKLLLEEELAALRLERNQSTDPQERSRLGLEILAHQVASRAAVWKLTAALGIQNAQGQLTPSERAALVDLHRLTVVDSLMEVWLSGMSRPGGVLSRLVPQLRPHVDRDAGAAVRERPGELGRLARSTFQRFWHWTCQQSSARHVPSEQAHDRASGIADAARRGVRTRAEDRSPIHHDSVVKVRPHEEDIVSTHGLDSGVERSSLRFGSARINQRECCVAGRNAAGRRTDGPCRYRSAGTNRTGGTRRS